MLDVTLSACEIMPEVEMLSSEDILLIMDKLGREVVVEESDDFRFEITKRRSGWSDDLKIGKLQAKLSIMLEVARNREKE
jgi:hypothetical protein